LVNNTAALKKEAGFSERLHTSYQCTQCHNLEDRKENLRSKVRNIRTSTRRSTYLRRLLSFVAHLFSQWNKYLNATNINPVETTWKILIKTISSYSFHTHTQPLH